MNRTIKRFIGSLVICCSIMIGTTAVSAQNDWIGEIARQEGVPPSLVYAVIKQESSFNQSAISPKGAIGLMQLMPKTARNLGVNAYHPVDNVRGGTRYLRKLLKMFGNRVDLALAGYNAGEGKVIKYGYRIPPYRETQNYVRRILANLQSNSIVRRIAPEQISRTVSVSPVRTNVKPFAGGKQTFVVKKPEKPVTSSSFLF